MADEKKESSLVDGLKSVQNAGNQAGPAAAASYTLIGAIVFLGGIGYGIDVWKGTGPWGVVIGLLLGVVIGFYELIKSSWKR